MPACLGLVDGGGEDLGQRSNYLLRLGQRQQQAGALDEALATFEELSALGRQRGDAHQLAVARSCIADILAARGQLDEALRIRNEEGLPVYERLGDVRSVAVTKAQIADILAARGQLDEALRIRTQEVLPAMERLGDVHSVAGIKGQIADILQARGQLDEALRLQEERLTTNRRIGDADGIASTLWSIANIELGQKQFGEALPRLVEAWALFEQIGRADGLAVVGSVYGQFLAASGENDKARAVFERCVQAFRTLGRADQADQFEDMARRLMP